MKNNVCLSFMVLSFVMLISAASVDVYAQTSGGPPVPVGGTCSACHPDFPTICHSRTCAADDGNGNAFCGCTGQTGETSSGVPTIKAVCVYDPDCGV